MNPHLPLTAALTAIAVFVFLPDPPAVVLAKRLRRPGVPSRPARWIAATFTALLLTAWLGPPALLLLPAAALAAAVSRRVTRARTRRERESSARAAVREACELMSAELRAGRTPGQALDSAAAVFTGLIPAAAAASFGGDVPGALRSFHGPGEEALRPLAAAWSVAERSGASLAALLDRTVAALRESQAIRDEVSAQLASPRATSRVLAILPLAGVALGFGTGADPIGFLLGTPVGVACLLTGAALAGAGVFWVERLARSAEDTR